jgi:hypothetical protein
MQYTSFENPFSQEDGFLFVLFTIHKDKNPVHLT